MTAASETAVSILRCDGRDLARNNRSWPDQQRKFHKLQQPEGAAEEALGHEKPTSRLLAWPIDKDGAWSPAL